MTAFPSESSIHRRGLLLVLSSPSGAGKSTLSRRLLAEEPNLSMSVSMTTRPPRSGEVDGVHYHFVDHDQFDQMIAADGFMEYATVFGNQYGTPKAAVATQLADGRDVLFDIDWQGTQQIGEIACDDLVSVFILPPSAGELERRLRTRAQDSAAVIAQRMAKANDEVSHWAEYDYVIVNADLDLSVTRIRAILAAERLKRRRQIGLAEFVKTLQHVC
jgi:guanylate kinase